MITIGKIARPFGMGGAVRVISMTDAPDRFVHLEWVGLSDATEQVREVEVEDMMNASGSIILKLKGIDSRKDAERIRGQFLVVEPQSVPPLPEGRYYIHEIIGLEVVTDSGMVLGRVQDVLGLESNDVYVVRGERGDILIPAIKDIVQTIDIDAGRMIIHPMEGLLD